MISHTPLYVNACMLLNYELLLINFRDSHSRKRKFAGDGSKETDIFATLLDNDETDSQHSNYTQLTVVSSHYTLLASKLVDDILIGFCTAPDDINQIYLFLWKQQQQTNATNTLEFKPSPIKTIPHKHGNNCDLVVGYKRIPSVCSKIVASNSSGNAISCMRITDVLYSYLFGYENLLSNSSIVVFGWTCGCILACPLNRLGDDSSAQVICCLKQTIMSIEAFTVGHCRTDTNNSIMFVGSSGKVILFIAHELKVKHYELILPGPVLSAMFIPNMGLLYSSLDNVKNICLKRECCSKVECDNTEIFRLFENTLTIIDDPMFLLWHDDQADIIGVTLDGTIVRVQVDISDPTSATNLLSPSQAGESVKRSLFSIQSSSDRLDGIQRDINLVDESLVALNETMTLFNKLSIENGECPFTVHEEIVYEQIGVDEFTPQLEIVLAYNNFRPIRKGVSLVIEAQFDTLARMEMFVQPTSSKCDDIGEMFSQSVALGGLQKGGELRLKPKLSFRPLRSNSTLMITCHCSYKPPITDSLRKVLQNDCEDEVSLTQLNQKYFAPLDFISALRHSQCSQFDHSFKTVSISILPSTLSKLVKCTLPSNIHSEQLNCELLSRLISNSQIVREKIERYATPVSSVHGRGLELKAVSATGIILLQLYCRTAGNEVLYPLSISSSSLETSVILMDGIVQRIIKQVICNYVHSGTCL